MVRLSPPERIGEFFGLYGLVGKGSQVVGQLLYGADHPAVPRHPRATAPTRSPSLSLLVTMLIGLWLIWPVRDDWAGSGDALGLEVPHIPERLAPANAPIEPR